MVVGNDITVLTDYNSGATPLAHALGRLHILISEEKAEEWVNILLLTAFHRHFHIHDRLYCGRLRILIQTGDSGRRK